MIAFLSTQLHLFGENCYFGGCDTGRRLVAKEKKIGTRIGVQLFGEISETELKRRGASCLVAACATVSGWNVWSRVCHTSLAPYFYLPRNFYTWSVSCPFFHTAALTMELIETFSRQIQSLFQYIFIKKKSY